MVDRPDDGAKAPLLASPGLTAALVVLCLLLAGVAGFAWWRLENPPAAEAPSGAITSSQARDSGEMAASRLTQRVLSYGWQTLDEDIAAAEKVSAPSFRSRYAATMNGVRAQTVKNRVTLTASAVATSVVSASERKVVALVFVDQVTQARGTARQRLDQNRVLVTLTRDGGEWRVSKMTAF